MEVIIAIAVISPLLVASFTTARASLVGVRDSEEHSEATNILQAQVELLRPLATDVNAPIYTSGKPFCIDSGNDTMSAPFPGPIPATANADNFTQYPAVCSNINGLYNVAITYDQPSQVFTFYARWNRLSQGRDQVEFFYKIPAPPPSTSLSSLPHYTSCSDAGIRSETFFFDFTTTPFAADWKVWYHNAGRPPHASSTVPYTTLPVIPPGTYDYWAIAGDDTSFNPLANNRELHYVFYDNKGKVVAQTLDTPDFNVNPALSQPVMGIISVPPGQPISYIMVQHSPDQGGTDDAVFAACLALRIEH